MKINCLFDKLVSVQELNPHPNNANSHPKEQIERLAKILNYQGWRYPIKVSKQTGFITSGHGRLAAAIANGWAEVPVNFQDYDSTQQEYADLQADNAVASWSALDLGQINNDIADFDPAFDIELLGIKNFSLDIEPVTLDELNKEEEEKHVLEVIFPNDMELRDIHDDLVSRGYIVRVK